MPFEIIDQRRFDTTGLGEGGGGTVDFIYASRAAAEAATPTTDFIMVLHAERILAYEKADSGESYPALVTADGQKWLPATITISPLHWGAAGDNTTDDQPAIQAMLNYLTGSSASMLSSYLAGRMWSVDGAGKKYAISKPIMVGNLGDGVGLLYFTAINNLHLKAIQGAYDWTTTYGSAEVPSRMLVLAWQLNEDASDSISGIYKVAFNNITLDCNFLTGGIYLQNTTQLSFRDIGIDFLGKNCVGWQTSVGNKAQNPRGYKTVNGALLVENMNVQGYVEEAPKGDPLYPTGEDQDTMNTIAFKIMTNDARYHQIICSRVTQAMYINYCGAIQFSDIHPWSKSIYIGQNTNNLMFSNCYFDYTRVTVHDAFSGLKFVACHWILGDSDRTLELRTSRVAETGDGLMMVGCTFDGTSHDMEIEHTTDGTVGAYWVGVRDRKYQLTGAVFGASSAPEAYFKVGKNLTVDASNGHTYFRRNDDGYGRTELAGNNVTAGLDRSVAGTAGLYLQSTAGTGITADAAVYATTTKNLVLETAAATGEVIFGVNGFWGGTRVKPDSDMQIFGTTGVSTASTALKVGKNGTRSISASGTINASGADYAEYHQVISSLYGLVKPGDVLGFNASGLLTDRFDDVRGRFLIKSTGPNLVGHDAWGSEEYLCEKYDVEPVGEMPELRVAEPSEAELETHAGELAAWEVRRGAMQAAYDAERPKWDRMAKCGIVPVNGISQMFYVGEYLIPVKAPDGGIAIELVAQKDLTFSQYVSSIGCIVGFYEDGRPLVEVKTS